MIRFTLKFIAIGIVILLIDNLVSDYLKSGLKKFDQIDKKAVILITGNSHTGNGIDEKRLEKGLGVPVAKYSKNGATVSERLVMLKNYYNEQVHKPEIVVMDVDASIFGENIKTSYVRFYPYMDNPDVGQYIKASGATWDEYFSRKILKLLRYNDIMLIRSSIKGHLNKQDEVSSEIADIARVNKFVNKRKPAEILPEEVRRFEETIAYLLNRNAKIVLLFIPQMDISNASLKLQNAQAVKLLTNVASRHPDIVFLNYNFKYEHRHELFCDAHHVNQSGQRLVTENLVADLRNAMKNSDWHTAFPSVQR
jgi:uncharacterized protein YlbG (UPF0298 family)